MVLCLFFILYCSGLPFNMTILIKDIILIGLWLSVCYYLLKHRKSHVLVSVQRHCSPAHDSIISSSFFGYGRYVFVVKVLKFMLTIALLCSCHFPDK